MKKRTRAAAKFYIYLDILLILVFVLYLSAFFGGFGKSLGLEGASKLDSWAETTVSGIVLVVFIFLSLLPWIFLLKQHIWAWWILAVEYFSLSAILLSLAASLLFSKSLPAVDGSGGIDIVPLILYAVLLIICVGTFIVLLTDYPSGWKEKRIPGPRVKPA